ncbi:nucleotide exchange factor GrpE [Streptomyces sp. MJP52]|uniref:nucleotide exchange factor GrpE n=1 Tax=Streptomyces sp. MJP52 TaxID=2940555 RepID=UPI0024748992|nr:nucleotide exchange factor GrpE [Streptomyces sp. MJP52]MDH6223280.1 molecular chaperone GrpE (heat shock protein) [Streptomyces sp. MJP52]
MTSVAPDRRDPEAELLIAQLRTRCEALDKRRGEYERELASLRAEHKSLLRRLVGGLLDVDDTLAESVRWALRQGPRQPAVTLEKVVEQVSAAHRLLRLRLEAADVRPMNLTHQIAVPGVAKVVETRPTSRHPVDTVLEERMAGFYLGRQVLRKADVVIAVDGPDFVEPEEPDEDSRRSAPAARRRQPRRLPRHRRRSRRRD